MAQSYNSADFGNLVIPQAVAKYNVQTTNAGVATGGIVMIVGEADAGPDYTLETNLNKNFFGPNSASDVIAKYQSGPIVDAVSAFSSPANDQNIPGAPTGFIIAKTNVSTAASGELLTFAATTYETVAASLRGANGNNIQIQVVPPTAPNASSEAEVVPTTGAFTVLVPIGAVSLAVRINGGASHTATVPLDTLPDGWAAALSGIAGITVTGGMNRAILTAGNNGNTLGLTAVGDVVTFTLTGGTLQASLVAGDTLWISATSDVATATGNSTLAGSYVITSGAAFGGTTFVAQKLQDASGTPGTLTTVSIGTASVTLTTASTDLEDFQPLTIAITAGNPVNGLGKSLEIAEVTTGTLTSVAYALSPTKVIWVSTAASPTGTSDGAPLISSQEYVAELQVTNTLTATTETFTAGGEVALELSYVGTTAQVVVGATSLVFSWTGGSNATPGSTFTLPFSTYKTIASVVAFLNAQVGFSAVAGTALLGMLPTTALDEGMFTIGSTYGAATGRLKIDAYRFQTRALSQSTQIQLSGTQANSGLPAPQAAPVSLMGGARGGTTNANITGAMDALQNVTGNFLVTLFSQDASADIIAGVTDVSSTYTIALINAYARTHVLLCSQPKRKKSRQAMLSILNTFANDQDAASSLASFRCSMCFQSVQNISTSQNAVILFQPWMLSGLAASMQAAGGYKGIVGKYANCESVIQAGAGLIPDYNDQNDDDETTALQAGLLPAKNDQNAGGVFFVSDQTTYGSDNNFVFNSIQAVYVADTMALTLAMRMQRAFVGQSLADISAAQAVSTVQGILQDFLTAKLIAPSQGAPRGYQPGSIVIKISGTVMTVNLTVYLAGLLYFVPIVFQINQVQQTATA